MNDFDGSAAPTVASLPFHLGAVVRTTSTTQQRLRSPGDFVSAADPPADTGTDALMGLVCRWAS